ncbi:MAG TPA: carboxypeptidase-like regulatory domain-containing protein [Saprospiraceae bacterium]|nr:carboxypeptidase-like regulatory domain-containing protein [Saprospiraceae bacterium]
MKYIDLSKLPLCDQNWATMPKIDGGRLCEKCDTKMIDFSGMTNLEIIKIHAETEGRVCGHYLPSQLASPFQEKEAIDQPSILAKALLGLTTLTTTLFVNPSASVAQIPVEKVEQSQNQQVSRQDSVQHGAVQQHLVLKGQIIDDKAQPLAYASVYVKETEWGVSADKYGLFTLILDKEAVCKKDSFTLVYFFLGFQTVENEYECAAFDDKDDVWLGEQVLETQDEITVTEAVVRGSKPKIERYYSIPFIPEKKKKWWQKGFLGRIFRKRK